MADPNELGPFFAGAAIALGPVLAAVAVSWGRIKEKMEGLSTQLQAAQVTTEKQLTELKATTAKDLGDLANRLDDQTRSNREQGERLIRTEEALKAMENKINLIMQSAVRVGRQRPPPA